MLIFIFQNQWAILLLIKAFQAITSAQFHCCWKEGNAAVCKKTNLTIDRALFSQAQLVWRFTMFEALQNRLKQVPCWEMQRRLVWAVPSCWCQFGFFTSVLICPKCVLALSTTPGTKFNPFPWLIPVGVKWYCKWAMIQRLVWWAHLKTTVPHLEKWSRAEWKVFKRTRAVEIDYVVMHGVDCCPNSDRTLLYKGSEWCEGWQIWYN